MNKAHLYAGIAALSLAVTPVAAQFWGFGGGGERKLVKQFDRDGDGKLNPAERALARGKESASASRSASPKTAGRSVTPATVKTYPASTPFYDPFTLRTVFLEFESDGWESELEDFHDTDVEVPATLTLDGKTYRGVGMQFRGATSFRYVSAGSKRPFNVSIDFTDKKQELLGYNSLNFLNARNDPSFVRTVLYSHIARQYITAPKVNFINVVINGENWGVYVNAQQFNRDMMREFLADDAGARWKVPGSPSGRGGLEYLGEDVAAYKAIYDIRTRDDPKIWAQFIALTRVLNQTPPEKLEAALSPILDVDGTLKFLAVEVALANSDGYWSRASDYNIYLDTKGRFHIIPHDMNEALGRNAQLDPLVGTSNSRMPLRQKLLAVPALRARYLGYVRDIARNGLDPQKTGPLVDRYQALIAASVAADGRKLYGTEQFAPDAQALKTWMDARRAFLLAGER